MLFFQSCAAARPNTDTFTGAGLDSEREAHVICPNDTPNMLRGSG